MLRVTASFQRKVAKLNPLQRGGGEKVRWTPERATAGAASFYGTWLVSEAEESPHLSSGRVKGERRA